MAKFNQSERDAIGVFLNDTYHHKEIRRKMQLLADMHEMEELFLIIDKLVGIGTINDHDAIYLKQKMAKFYV
jgi:hypothetical protein